MFPWKFSLMFKAPFHDHRWISVSRLSKIKISKMFCKITKSSNNFRNNKIFNVKLLRELASRGTNVKIYLLKTRFMFCMTFGIHIASSVTSELKWNFHTVSNSASKNWALLNHCSRFSPICPTVICVFLVNNINNVTDKYITLSRIFRLTHLTFEDSSCVII